jgi:ABC-type uncharacterized transport system substrate-binding protein
MPMIVRVTSLLVRLAALAVVSVGMWTAPALAHPHAFITVHATAQFAAGKLTALRQVWTFDEMYSQQSLEDIKPDSKGRYGRAQLAELAKVNIEGLKEFNYFTTVKTTAVAGTFTEPKEYFLELVEVTDPPGPEAAMGEATRSAVKAKALRLTFVLPLAQPVAVDSQGAEIAITDPEIFIWFTLAKDGVKLAGAPADCQAIVPPQGPKIDEAFGKEGVVPEFKQTSFKLTCRGGS